MEWISVRVKVPVENTDCLISDGVNVGFGYFVAEYEAEDPKDPTQYSSEHWIQEGLVLNTCCSGFPEVTHWMKLPDPPFKIALGRHDFPISDKCTTSQ